MITPDDDLATRRAKIAAAVAASKQVGWQLYLHSTSAFVWRKVYGRSEPTAATVPAAKVRKLLPHLTPEEAKQVAEVRHTYSHIQPRGHRAGKSQQM